MVVVALEEEEKEVGDLWEGVFDKEDRRVDFCEEDGKGKGVVPVLFLR